MECGHHCTWLVIVQFSHCWLWINQKYLWKISYEFSNKNYIRLKNFRDVASWLQNDWCPCIDSLSVSSIVPKNHNIDVESNVNDTNAVANENVQFDESMNLFLDEDEDVNNVAESNNNVVLERSNKVGRFLDRQKKPFCLYFMPCVPFQIWLLTFLLKNYLIMSCLTELIIIQSKKI